MYFRYILRLALSPFYRLGSNDPAMNPMVRHHVIRIDFGGDRRQRHARTGVYLIDRPRLSCPLNSPHGWRKRAFPSLPSSARSPTHPHVSTYCSILSFNPHTLRACVYKTTDQLLTSLSMVSPCRPRIRHSGCLCTLQIASGTPCWQMRYPGPRLPRCYE